MKKKIMFSVMLLLSLLAQAQQAPARMSFDKDGTFKIAQFTDMHLANDPEKNRVVIDLLKEVLASEQPDLVVFTGDNTTTDEVQRAWTDIARELSARQTPWTAVLGNHDDEHAVNRKEIVRMISEQPYCILRNVAQGIDGEGNHIIPIYKTSDVAQPSALLYCFDSQAYSTLKAVKGYGWVQQSQVDWYRRESRRYTENNAGTPLPALAFLHIPLPEYTQAWESLETKRYGDRNEKECAPNVNSGLFVNLLQGGDVMGAFAGHDHVNDYIATLYGVALAYGRASGGSNTYGDKTPGSRIIVLKEGKREFDTWIREKGNTERLYNCAYPESFLIVK
ncbi:MAG: metallophosphoesterase family protein [Bacteroides sp.]|uniref:metallophosphoesterase family protein n=1 Tax=Bacteroides sp. TaxID=29523 RepID=UPI002FCC953E|nr:metallophosphoesterase family protein [Bacteroides sp.]